MSIGFEQAAVINGNPKSRVYAIPDGDKWKLVPRGGQKRSFFQGAVTNRLTTDWLAIEQSSNEQLKYALKRLIARSRELENNNEYWDGLLKQIERNVVGPDGIQLRMQIYEPDMKGGWTIDRMAGSAIEDAWRDFNKRQNFLITRDLTGIDAQSLIMRSIPRDGGVVIRILRGDQAENKYGITFQLLEVDHLDPELNTKHNGNDVIMGVEVDKFRRVIAYHLLSSHPGDDSWHSGGKKYVRVPAADIIHPFKSNRIGQVRGLPWCASTMAALRMLGGYKEAELVAARQAASQGGFFRDPQGTGNPYEADSERECDPQSIQPMEPGMTQYIGDLEFVGYNPNHPVQAFGDFVNETLRGFSVGNAVSHHNATGNMTQVNYSSARIAELAERDQWKLVQRWFSDSVLQPMFDEWLFASLMQGAIKTPAGAPLPASKLDKFSQATWRGRRWQWVDPAKEVASQEKLMQLNLTSRGRIMAENGLDEEDIYEEIVTSDNLMKAKGIKSETQPPQVDKPPSSKDQNDDED